MKEDLNKNLIQKNNLIKANPNQSHMNISHEQSRYSTIVREEEKKQDKMLNKHQMKKEEEVGYE